MLKIDMDWLITLYSIMFFFGIYFILLFVILHFQKGKYLYDYPKAKKFPSVSFITPAYNEEDSIIETLKSLLKVDYPEGKKEIIVINDGSTDKTKEVIEKFIKKHPEIIFLDKKNSGKADSLNKAINLAKGELVAVVDADSHPVKDSLKKMVGYFEEDEKMAAVTSKVLVKNKNNLMEKFQDIDYVVIAWTRKILDFIDCVYVTNGPLSVYRKSLVKKIGGFNTKVITEDIEITWNFLSKGYKTKMSYPAVAYTKVPSTLSAWINQRIRWNIGGLQTLDIYKKFIFRGKNLFGYFVITYVSLSFILSFLGIFLLFRFLYFLLAPSLVSIPYLFQGYNPFIYLDFYFPFTILLILGLSFLGLSLIYHKIALKNSDLEKKGIITIFKYAFFYRALYMIPLIVSLYKMARGNIGWYTK